MNANYPPLRKRPLVGLGRLLIGSEERLLVEEVLEQKLLNRFFSPSPEQEPRMAKCLEEELKQLTGASYALAVTSGSAALECALGALEVGPGDEVILPAWSWIACFTAIVRLGATPVLAEVDDTLCLDPNEIPRLANERTKAILVVHFQGTPARMDAIMENANRAGVAVLEDCAQSPGAFYGKRRVGTIGAMGIYSFQNQKTITSGEGGAVLTNDSRLFERAVRMHDLGLYRPIFESQVSPEGPPFGEGPEFSGGQFRMAELTAAVALAQLRKLDHIREHCRRLDAAFREAFGECQFMRPRGSGDARGDSRIEAYFFCDPLLDPVRMRKSLEAHNVNCIPMTGTYCHYNRKYCSEGTSHHPRMSAFPIGGETPANYRKESFPRTESLVSSLLSIPFGIDYTEDDARYIAGCLQAAVKEQLQTE